MVASGSIPAKYRIRVGKTIRPSKEHRYYAYVLRHLVFRYARSKPLAYFKDIYEYMTIALRADSGYQQVLTHKFTHEVWNVVYGHFGGCEEYQQVRRNSDLSTKLDECLTGIDVTQSKSFAPESNLKLSIISASFSG